MQKRRNAVLKSKSVTVPASFPKFIKSSSTNHESWINFKAISSKARALEELFKTFHISLDPNIWKIRHHMSNYL